MTVGEEAEREQVERLRAWRASRNDAAAGDALRALRDALTSGDNLVEPSIAAAKAGVTTGEWGAVMREHFGEWRAPTGVSAAAPATGTTLDAGRAEVARVAEVLGRPPKLLIGKPGLDGHSNGAEQVAVRAMGLGFEVVYEGIRLTPEQIAAAAEEEGVHAVGLSILSGSHMALVPQVMAALAARGLGALPVFVGGIIPESDREPLATLGVAKVFTPSDFDLTANMLAVAALIGARAV